MFQDIRKQRNSFGGLGILLLSVCRGFDPSPGPPFMCAQVSFSLRVQSSIDRVNIPKSPSYYQKKKGRYSWFILVIAINQTWGLFRKYTFFQVFFILFYFILTGASTSSPVHGTDDTFIYFLIIFNFHMESYLCSLVEISKQESNKSCLMFSHVFLQLSLYSFN